MTRISPVKAAKSTSVRQVDPWNTVEINVDRVESSPEDQGGPTASALLQYYSMQEMVRRELNSTSSENKGDGSVRVSEGMLTLGLS